MALIYVVISLFIIYSILIIYYWLSWKAIPDFQIVSSAPAIKISVVIAARNEENAIHYLLEALNTQSYPAALTEIIVVDDQSTDKTAEVTKRFSRIKLIQIPPEEKNSRKKKAIETGIAAATGELIVTTDADCIPPPDWLKTIAAFKEQQNPVCIAAPVGFTHSSSLLSIFQELDFLVLQGITGAAVYKNAHSMCNGANFIYERAAFYEIDGFTGIDNIASGDDMLLMHKIWKKYPSRVSYLKSKEVIVTTPPMQTWRTFFNQRIRWASKARLYDDKRIFFILLLVYLFNLSFLALFVAGFWMHIAWLWLAGLWIAKAIIEFPFVYSVTVFFNKQHLLKYFFFFQPLHIFYTIISGFLGQTGKYEWKGRKVK